MSHPGRPRRKDVVDIDQGDPAGGDSEFAADCAIYFSSDGRRRQEELLNIGHKKRRVQPTELDDTFAQWIPVPDDGIGAEDAVPESATAPGKRKEYVSTRDPMSLWRPLKGFFLDELNRHESLGDDLSDPRCAHCHSQFDLANPDAVKLLKCYECGDFPQCEGCCVTHHAKTPLHVLRRWNGNFWVACTLESIGLIYQLGHGGLRCPFPDEKVRSMVVIETPIIHQIKLRYCKCEKSDSADNLQQLMRNAWYPATVTDPGTCATFRSLESYRLFSVVGNMNVKDFITSLERVTDASASSGMTWLPDRYKQFQRMARQWSFLKRLQRAGRGHDPAGVDATALGECAVTCWACPHDGRNLPSNWRDVDPKLQFLYMLLLAVDANFRLKNRMRINEIDDPSLGPGWGYWVEPRQYKEHLSKYIHEKDMSTCIAFAALLQKDTRLTTGLRVSGVGGCVCARHECMWPNGLGDLQKGERYANMDFIVMAALAGFSLLLLTISYDIACQWKINLRERNAKLPAEIRLPMDKIQVQCALPVWHAGSHNAECANANSLSFKPGVGKSDGEGVERTWAVLNPASFATKDAGRGQRADALEGKIDNHNWLKNVGEGERRLVVAIAERDRQVKGFKDVNRTVEREVKDEWKGMINDWLADSSKPNPYILSRKDCPTETEVRLEIRRDEEALATGGQTPLHGRSASAMLIAGIQIEDAQRRIATELKGTVLVAADRENRIQEWRHALLVKIGKFRGLQKIYMPGAPVAIAEAEGARDEDAAPPKPEVIKLFMPSDMVPASVDDKLRGCVPGLLNMEAKLRISQCNNSLAALRSRLHAKRHLIGFRDSNVTGQIQSTKARTLIGQVGERVDGYATRYRKGREALLALKDAGEFPQFRELKPEDVRLDGDADESDAASRKKLAMLSAGRGARAPRNAPGTSKRVMSWIWTAPGALDDDEERLHESVRVEWARALARKTRWVEEVLLLREEMRRVLRYLAWQAAWWRARATLRSDLEADVETTAGVRAYALKQADWHERLAVHFRSTWNVSAATAARGFATDADVDPLGEEGLDQFFTR
ncbi:hypothetical protein B0H11DRAFT_1738205 [Mycena galericulata]|nr:hypothetical protein B0H11DRAFT_1738205 [Mycena galericulata]